MSKQELIDRLTEAFQNNPVSKTRNSTLLDELVAIVNDCYGNAEINLQDAILSLEPYDMMQVNGSEILALVKPGVDEEEPVIGFFTLQNFVEIVLSLIPPPEGGGGGSGSGNIYQLVAQFSHVDLNAAPDDKTIYLNLPTLADLLKNNFLVSVHYTIIGVNGGAVIAHASLAENIDDTEFFVNEGVISGVPDNKVIQNNLLYKDTLPEDLKYLKLKFSLDDSVNNPQDFTSAVIILSMQLNPILTA